ncbi:fumarylacetoacetate hydrolase family protein [Uliginosibacterium sediminicola]|uniref:Fumarylacetoacetate hydrolase family protein n=1 Tax=Uliginosibacterium sediminicola TaxID=2024550 RepID=A0ABU9Z3C4_9RHOO
MPVQHEYVFAPPATTSLPVTGGNARFPVRRIYCVGRNYLDHIRELGNDEKEPPIFFTKPRDAIVQDGDTIPYALATENYHFELELAVALHSGGYNIAAQEAQRHIFGYAIALDMTRRDLQKKLADKGKPWDVAKGFDHSCPCGPVFPVSQVGQLSSGRIHLAVNGQTRQDATLEQMIWGVPEIIAELSRHFELAAGDLILTGTPAGVGPIQPGDVLVGSIDKLGQLTTLIGPKLV